MKRSPAGFERICKRSPHCAHCVKRFLTTLLSECLARRGVQLNVNPLQYILGGRQNLARREVHDELLALLSAHGIGAEDEARAPASANRPQACSPAPHCRAIDPGICLTTAWAEDRRRLLAA